MSETRFGRGYWLQMPGGAFGYPYIDMCMIYDSMKTL